MGFSVIDGVLTFDPISAEDKARIVQLVTVLDAGQGVSMANLRPLSPVGRLETWNTLQALVAEGVLSKEVRVVNGTVNLEFYRTVING